MYVNKKQLMSKCRACGNMQQLDGMHRAGTQLMKQLPKNMSEIDAQNTNNTTQTTTTTEESKKEETKKVKEEEEDDGGVVERLGLDSEEIGK